MTIKLGPIDKRGYPLFIQLGEQTPVVVGSFSELKSALRMLREETPLRITDADGNEVYKQ